MTENKRYSFNWERGHPNFWDNDCDVADCYLTCEDVVKLLNELNDENTELKKENRELKHEVHFYKSFQKDARELEHENRQLKADNNRLVNETAKIIAEHQGRILDLIDEKIKENKRDYKMTYESELKGRIEVLEELKKELSD